MKNGFAQSHSVTAAALPSDVRPAYGRPSASKSKWGCAPIPASLKGLRLRPEGRPSPIKSDTFRRGIATPHIRRQSRCERIIPAKP